MVLSKHCFMSETETTIIKLPKTFKSTYFGGHDLDRTLSFFDWNLKDKNVIVDFRECKKANYQTLTLLVLYLWQLNANGCDVELIYDAKRWRSASEMWMLIGATELFDVLGSSDKNFQSDKNKHLLAIRNSSDFRAALEKVESYVDEFDVEYKKTLRYVVSEVLYNTLEHGHNLKVPSLIQCNWYESENELSFIVADLGIGIKDHLRQAYPQIETDAEAIKYALKPQVSGTFNGKKNYEAKNNAGVGLFISSNIIRKLNANMFIVSGNGVVHISPTDITEKTLESHWKGTLVYVTVKLGLSEDLNLQKMMSELREKAMNETAERAKQERQEDFCLNIRNYFSRYAEDKSQAKKIRDEKLLPAIAEGKTITLDFDEVILAPHSFLTALLATPIRQYGLAAYKKIKIINAPAEIQEIVGFIFDDNTQ
jgi:anti-sigma regulatory factor (Ser/Thr protein kinase)